MSQVITNLDEDDDEDPDRSSESRLEENDFGNIWEGASSTRKFMIHPMPWFVFDCIPSV